MLESNGCPGCQLGFAAFTAAYIAERYLPSYCLLFYKPEMKEGNPIRLYSLDEITEIFGKLGLRICNSFADFSGKPSSDNDIQLMVYSIRE